MTAASEQDFLTSPTCSNCHDDVGYQGKKLCDAQADIEELEEEHGESGHEVFLRAELNDCTFKEISIERKVGEFDRSGIASPCSHRIALVCQPT